VNTISLLNNKIKKITKTLNPLFGLAVAAVLFVFGTTQSKARVEETNDLQIKMEPGLAVAAADWYFAIGSNYVLVVASDN